MIRIGVTGLARSGKTALLTSIAGNLLALGKGAHLLPGLRARLGGRSLTVGYAPAGAGPLPRFPAAANLAALAADPPRWPDRTDGVSMLALDVRIERHLLGMAMPPRHLRLEMLDYPGEWLLDLPLLGQNFGDWSAAVLRRLEGRAEAAAFLAFVHALPADAPADEALAAAGHQLYRSALLALRDAGLSFLQPGRFLMPPPGAQPPWFCFFPALGKGALRGLLAARFDALCDSVRRELAEPSFGRADRVVVLADLLGSLHGGPTAFADARAALREAAGAINRPAGWLAWLDRLLPGAVADWALPWRSGPRRLVWAATKADHVGRQQRGNLARLLASLAPAGSVPCLHMALASVRCTEDVTHDLAGRPVSAVRGRLMGDERAAISYPGEVPDTPPDEIFWQHRFLALPELAPARLPDGGRGGVPQIGLDEMLCFLLDDLL